MRSGGDDLLQRIIGSLGGAERVVRAHKVVLRNVGLVEHQDPSAIAQLRGGINQHRASGLPAADRHKLDGC
jgi:hypothetical protein